MAVKLKLLKERIVSFRITEEDAEIVEKLIHSPPHICRVKSVNQWFRKIGLDFIAGRMAHKDPVDMLLDKDS
jgi:hypothetical protein